MKQWVCALLAVLMAIQAPAQDETEKIAEAEKKHAALLRNYDQFSISSPNFDVHYYRCEWIIDPAVRFITGKVTNLFTITLATNTITYDFTTVLTVDSVVYHGVKIPFAQISGNGLRINFPNTISAGTKDSVSIFYKGVPPFGAFTATMHSGVPVIWTLSEPYGARTWWPCRDVLRDKADSIDIIITNPLNYISSSNGMPTEVVNSTSRTTYWKHRYPIVAYLVAIAVTNYAVTNEVVQMPGGLSMPLSMYAYPESAAAFIAATNAARTFLQQFPPLITDYPFVKERYAQTQYGSGGMEHQTNSFIANPGSGLVAHEAAHQWFGDKITCGSWEDLWLNEGFASYMEYVFVELNNPGAKLNFLKNWTNHITSSPGGSVFVPDTLNVGRLFDSRLTYRKGGYVLHMMRWKLGDSTFFRGVRRYMNDPALAYKTARTIDLQRNMEAESGQDLTEFLQDWFYREGYPDYNAEWMQQGNGNVRVKLFQAPSHNSVSFFEMPVPLYFKNSVRDTIIRVNHTHSGQMFSFNIGFVADSMIIDPQLWILSRNKTMQKVNYVAPEELLIFPNPAVSFVQIEFPANVGGGHSVDVFNVLGQRLHSFNTGPVSTMYTIPTMHWAAGVYWLRISKKGTADILRKFIVMRK